MMKRVSMATVVFLVVVFALALNAGASRLLVAGGGANTFGYGYGQSNWGVVTNALNTAFGGAENVDVANNLEDWAVMSTYDALWVDTRFDSQTLSSSERLNLWKFLETGRRVVMMGDNPLLYTPWDEEILSFVPGSLEYEYVFGYQLLLTASSHLLTEGVSLIEVSNAGVAMGGQSLFDRNVATLWSDYYGDGNVLTILDNDLLAVEGVPGNARFLQNVAGWLAGPQPVPIPAAAWLLGSGLAGLAAWRKRFK